MYTYFVVKLRAHSSAEEEGVPSKHVRFCRTFSTQILTTLWLSHHELLRCTVSCELGGKTNTYCQYVKEYRSKWQLMTLQLLPFHDQGDLLWFILIVSMHCLITSTSVCDLFEVIKIHYFTEQWSNISCTRRRQRYQAEEAGNHQQMLIEAPCKRAQHCWMLYVASDCTPCCMLLGVVNAKFETGQTLEPTTPNISFAQERRRVAQQ